MVFVLDTKQAKAGADEEEVELDPGHFTRKRRKSLPADGVSPP
jgi:hypothetical protein